MSEAKHTPGPWRGDCEIIGNSRVVATTAWCSGFKEEDEANARLIAAAPDLLAALKRITAGLSDAEDLRALIKGDEVKQARAAIAKAEPRSNKEEAV